MASTPKKADDQQVRQRRGNDEQEARYPYGGDRKSPPRPKEDYLNPAREADVSQELKRSARKSAGKRSGPRR